MSRRLVILSDPTDRKEGWVKKHINETLLKLGASADVLAVDMSEELVKCRDKAAFKKLLPAERDRLKTQLPSDCFIFAPGPTASHLAIGRVRQDKALCGYAEPSLLGPDCIVSYSPGILRDSDRPSHRGVFERHLWKAWMLATGRAPTFRWPRVVTLEADGEEAVLAALEALAQAGVLGVDVETPMVGEETFFQDIDRLLNVGFGSVELDLAVSVTWYNASPAIKARALELLAGQADKVMHNGSFDMAVFAHHKMPVARWTKDTMEIWRFLFPKLPRSLAYVAGFLTFCPDWKESFKSGRKAKVDAADYDAFSDADAGERALYNARDSWLQARCWVDLEPVVARRERGPEQLETLASCLNIGVKMFVHGIPVSKAGVEGWRAPLKEKAVAAKAALLERVEKAMLWDVGLGEFNPNKPAHIRWLFSQLGVPSPKKTAKGLDSFDAEALVKLKEHPAPTVAELAAAILAEREPKKLLSTYIDGLPVHPDGRVHPRWAPLATLTGRWSSRQPNAQNIPDYMYGIFEVAPGLWWVKVDQSQLELRIAAFFSGEERLIQAYLDGADVHSMNARVFFGLPPGAKVTKPMRQFAKGGAYGLGYGAADKTVLARMKENEAIPREMRDRIGLPEMAQARYNYFKAYPGIKRRQEETLRFAMENRYIEEEISGRRVYFPGEVDVSVVYNFPIQTFAGKVMNDGIIELDAALDWGREAILDQVHDSVTVCGPDPERLFQLLKRCFEREYTYRGRTMRFRIEGKYGQGQLSGGTPFDADATVLPPPP